MAASFRIEDLDPELRRSAKRFGSLLKPSRLRYRLFNLLTRLARAPSVDGYVTSTQQVPRSNGDGTIRTRILRPAHASGDLPCLLYLHGGGYALGSPDVSGDAMALFGKAHDCVIVAPAYRRSLEAPYPAAIDDCHDTLVWARDNAKTLGIRTDQIFVGGHSAGGGLTAALSVRARDRKSVRIAFQMPIYPMIDDRMQNASAQGNTAPVWNTATNSFAWALYLKGLHDAGAPIPADAAAARAVDYSGLPPTATFVGDLEPFADETVAYVEALRGAGVEVAFEMYSGCYHAFDMLAPDAAVSKRARAFIGDAFARACRTHFADQY